MKEAAQMKKIEEERAWISSEVLTKYSTADLISVDTEFKEVTFDVDISEFTMAKRNFSTTAIDFTFESSDSSCCSLKFSYSEKQK